MLRHRPGADSLDGCRIAAEGAEPDVRLSLNETSSQHRVRDSNCRRRVRGRRVRHHPGAAEPPQVPTLWRALILLLANTGVPHTCAANRL